MTVTFQFGGHEYKVEGNFDGGSPDTFLGQGDPAEFESDHIYCDGVEVLGDDFDTLMDNYGWYDDLLTAGRNTYWDEAAEQEKFYAEPDDPMDGDAESARAGWGVDENYGCLGDEDC
jgi:hypothetical protein